MSEVCIQNLLVVIIVTVLIEGIIIVVKKIVETVLILTPSSITCKIWYIVFLIKEGLC